MKKLLVAIALSAMLFACSKSPTAPQTGPTDQTFTLTTTESSAVATVFRIPDKASYKSGDPVMVGVAMNAGYIFSGWTGDTSTAADTVILAMNGNKTLIAHFRNSSGTTVFAVSANATNGRIVLSPAGGVYDSATVVTAQAEADLGCRFTGWSGGLSGSDSIGTLVMTRNISVTANFLVDTTQKYVTVHVSPAPLHGRITFDPAGSPSGDGFKFKQGTIVTIDEIPDSGYEFTSWTGDFANEYGPSVTGSLDTNITVSAAFDKIPVVPDLSGVWRFWLIKYYNQYGILLGFESFDTYRCTMTVNADSTYTADFWQYAPVSGNMFGATGTGTWSATASRITFSGALNQSFSYTWKDSATIELIGGSMDITVMYSKK